MEANIIQFLEFPRNDENIFQEMIIFFESNLKYWRKKNGLTQDEAAAALDLKRTTYANYESGHSKADYVTLVNISSKLGITIDALISEDLANAQLNEKALAVKRSVNAQPNAQRDAQLNDYFQENFEDSFQVNEAPVQYIKDTGVPKVISVDSQGNENVIYVPVKARAGYLSGYGDPDFLAKLPAYRLPGVTGGTYRMFEVQGHSMFPTFSDKDRVVCRPETIENIKDDRNYVVVTRTDGILVKRLLNRSSAGIIICKSDHNLNGEYPPIILDVRDIAEVWYITVRMTNQMAGPGEIHKRMSDLEADIILLKETLLKGRLNAP